VLDTPSLYLPEVSPILAGHEVPQLQEAFPTEVGEIDKLRAQLQTPQRSYDLDTLLQLRQTPRLRESQPYWHLIIITVSCTLTVILVLYCSLRVRFHHLLLCNANSDTNPAPQNLSTPIPVPRHIEESHKEEFPKEAVSFTTYSMPQNYDENTHFVTEQLFHHCTFETNMQSCVGQARTETPTSARSNS